MLTVLYLEDRFFPQEICNSKKIRKDSLKIELKDAVSLATKILRYPLNSKNLQKLDKAPFVRAFSPPIYSEALLCNYRCSYRQIKYSLK